jgi:hypothetical protein
VSEAVVESRICEAIRGLKMLEFVYDERPRGVQPYCHGFKEAGDEVLRAIQVEGESRSGPIDSGKLWTVAKIRNLRVSERSFEPNDPKYNPNDKAMATIHCRVERSRGAG